MTKLNGLDAIRLVAFGALLVLPATSWAQQRPPILDQVAKTYGIDSFGQVEGIRFTFSAALPAFNVYRSWEWNTKTDTVSFDGKDKEGKPLKVTYQRSQLGSQSDVVKTQVDPAFVNDQFWLLLPLFIAWNGSPSVTDEGMQKLPSGKGSAQRVVVKYPSEGYSPGDTWELYVGADKRIKEIVFRRGGAAKPSLVIASWTGYKKAGPLLFSTEHHGTADGKPLRLSFLHVAVKLAGSDTWIDAR
ncbi:MAG TPA: hypothetical protein VEJ16_18300 [Alphaproteobacteria bacterium]|nr:hypothetical protein [Alphaproteobacteria bacterium]